MLMALLGVSESIIPLLESNRGTWPVELVPDMPNAPPLPTVTSLTCTMMGQPVVKPGSA